MTCGYPGCKNRATWLVKITVRPRGPRSDQRLEFIPGIKTCNPHIPCINEIGNNIKEFAQKALDNLGGVRPYTLKSSAIPIDSAEAVHFFAMKGN